MKITAEKLKELLVVPGFVRAIDFKSAIERAKKEKISLERVLVEEGLISDENLGKTIAGAFDYNFVDLKKVKILTGIIWLNMSPLHHYSFNLFLYYFGKLNLWRAIQEK